MNQIFKHSYGEIETINIVYENKQGYFFESKDGKSLYLIEKKEIDMLFKKDYGNYSSLEKAKKSAIKYLEKTIAEKEKRLKKIK